MSEIEEIEETKLDELVKVYLTIRNERERLEAEWSVKDKELKQELDVLAQTFMVHCNESNAKSIRTDYGTIMRKLNERYTVSDGEAFRKFVMVNQMPELLEARIAQNNFKEFIAERKADGLPPGVNVMREFTIVVRKPS